MALLPLKLPSDTKSLLLQLRLFVPGIPEIFLPNDDIFNLFLPLNRTIKNKSFEQKKTGAATATHLIFDISDSSLRPNGAAYVEITVQTLTYISRNLNNTNFQYYIVWQSNCSAIQLANGWSDVGPH
jgi:hypothetical protein